MSSRFEESGIVAESPARAERLAEAAGKHWDAIVVGGGMGGSAVGYALTRRGFRVLMLEKGLANPLPDEGNSAVMSDDPDYRIQRGRWPVRLDVRIDGTDSAIRPALGCGIGGSTLIYAAALGRLERDDFESRRLSDGSSISWPFGYDDIEPYYQVLEAQFGVTGTPDPLAPHDRYDLREPAAMGDCDRHFFQVMRRSGLHPYRLHSAIRYVAGCDECGGRFCPNDCKGDARNRLAMPAMQSGRLEVLDGLEVTRIVADRSAAQGVLVRRDGQDIEIKGRAIVLAAGALVTPVLLQRSFSEAWPRGIGNDHDLVGRYLMFHASDFVAVWPKERIPRTGPGRTLALRDFYRDGADKLGEFQSMGLSAGYPEILTFLHQWIDQSPLRRVPLLRQLMRIPAWIGARLFSEASVFATIVEDDPHFENRVTNAPDRASGMLIDYRIPDDLRRRVQRMRKLLKSRLKDLRILVVNQDVTLNYGHACGTCRAGADPETSVVDPDCRVHGISNLYVADGSIMPTSGGANPSLTIGANALRVSEAIVRQLETVEG